MAQPPTTYIAVAYARNEQAMVAQDFTTDHGSAAKAIRLPLGSGGAFTSPTSPPGLDEALAGVRNAKSISSFPRH